MSKSRQQSASRPKYLKRPHLTDEAVPKATTDADLERNEALLRVFSTRDCRQQRVRTLKDVLSLNPNGG